MSIKGQEKAALNAVLKGLCVYEKFMESSCKGYDFTNCSFGKGGEVDASKGSVTTLIYDTTDPYLKAKNCFLSTEIGNLNNLDSLALDDPNGGGKGYLSGKIPTEIGNCNISGSLFLGNNNLTGPIPTEIGNLTKLDTTLSLTLTTTPCCSFICC